VQPLPDVERIALLRANGIGDLVFALPAFDALRRAYPQAHITLLAAPWHVQLFLDRPAPFDEVIAVPPSKGVLDSPDAPQDSPELREFFAGMRERRFDLAIQMHGGGRWSNPFLLQLGARVTAGLSTPDAERLDIQLPYVYYQPETLRLLELVSLVGAPPLAPLPKIEVTERDRREALRVVPAIAQELVLMHPGAGDPRRRWPAEKFATVADSLARQGYRIALVGSAGSAHLTEAVKSHMAEEALDLAGKIDLGGFLGLLSLSELLITNDSGPLHLATATGTASVAIYWCGNLINAGQPLRARHRSAISWRLQCPVCGKDCTKEDCPHEESFVADVPVEEVEGYALELLGDPLGAAFAEYELIVAGGRRNQPPG